MQSALVEAKFAALGTVEVTRDGFSSPMDEISTIGCFWFGLPLVGFGCLWLGLAASGWVLLPLVGFGCLWFALAASGWLWLALACSG